MELLLESLDRISWHKPQDASSERTSRDIWSDGHERAMTSTTPAVEASVTEIHVSHSSTPYTSRNGVFGKQELMELGTHKAHPTTTPRHTPSRKYYTSDLASAWRSGRNSWRIAQSRMIEARQWTVATPGLCLPWLRWNFCGGWTINWRAAAGRASAARKRILFRVSLDERALSTGKPMDDHLLQLATDLPPSENILLHRYE